MFEQPTKSPDLVESFSGIRGIYGQGITEELAYQYAFCFAQLFCNQPDVLVIGGDTRPSTLNLKQAMLRAFTDAGLKKVLDLGVVPVQVAEYAVVKLEARGGVYITASHNEPEYNGWKFLKEDGSILYPEQSDKLIAQVYSESKPQAAKNTAELEVINRHQEAIDEYIKYVVAKIGPESQRKIKQMGLKLLIDPNGGAALVVLSQLFSELGVEAEIINNQPGQFNRLIEPKAESLSYLSDRMASNDFAFAVGFDCDADRMEIVLSPSSAFAKKMGTPNVSGNYVLALACDAILRGTKGEVVPTNDVTSYLVRDVIKKYGAAIDEVEVGEINVVEAMEAKDSIIGGEGSCAGVIVFPIKCRDGLITMVLALKLIADEGKGLSEILNNYPEYFSDRTKVASSPERAVVIRGKIEEYFEAKNWLVKKTGDATGGLKAHLDENSYVWFRQSKTEPGVFRIYAEGDGSQKKVTDLLGEGVRAFNQFNN